MNRIINEDVYSKYILKAKIKYGRLNQVFACMVFIAVLSSCGTENKKPLPRPLSSMAFQNTVYEYAESSAPRSCNADSIPAGDCGGGKFFFSADGKVVHLAECIGSEDIVYDIGEYIKGDTGLTCVFSSSYVIPYPNKYDSTNNLPDLNAGVLNKIAPFSLQLNTLACTQFDFYAAEKGKHTMAGIQGNTGIALWKADTAKSREFLSFAKQIKALSGIFSQSSDIGIGLESSATIEEQVQRIKEFLRWYGKNTDSLNRINMVNHTDSKDTSLYYSVNFPGTEHYLSELKKSGYFSESYLESRRAYFKACDAYMKKNPQNDGPPYGFEYDWIMCSQELTADPVTISECKVISKQISGKEMKIIIAFADGERLKYTLVQEGKNWLIANIENVSR